MASILQELRDLVSENMFDLINKARDPEKAVNNYIRKLENSINKSTDETAAVMANTAKAERAVRENEEEIQETLNSIKNALISKDEAAARTLTNYKLELESKRKDLEDNYNASKMVSDEIEESYRILRQNLKQAYQKRDSLTAKLKTAKVIEKTAKTKAALTGASGVMSSFDSLEEKANARLDEARAKSELLKENENDDIAKLKDKYSTSQSNVDAELEKLKKEMGIE